MISIKRYAKAESLEQAYEWNQKKANRIIGGMIWLKMGDKNINTAIDLSGVVSNQIEETEDEFIIGAMTTLHDLELHEGLDRYTAGALKESLRHIVGVQFRNVATAGGSIFGRFGFSDVLTMFLALDTDVELYKGGRISLESFAAMPYDNDILIRIIVKKTPIRTAYMSMRNTKTDFPVLACAVAFTGNTRRAVIGARPKKAVIISANEAVMAIDESDPETLAAAFAAQVGRETVTESNMRASAEYRKHLAEVLTKRACRKVLEKGGSEGC